MTTHLQDTITAISRAPDGFIFGTKDIHGRKFISDSSYFLEDGSFHPKLQEFIDSLKIDSVHDLVTASIMYYDIRSKLWKEHPAFGVLLAFAYARKLQEKTGKKTGHVIHIGVDAYQKHFDAAQVFVDALLRTGVTADGGGVVYWGVINGGDIRNYGQIYQATHGTGGNWAYFTMSHRVEDFCGAKLGLDAKVVSGSELRHVEGVTSGTIYDYIVDGKFPTLNTYEKENSVLTISDFTKHNVAVARDLVNATCGVSDDKPFTGVTIGFDMGGSPIGHNVVKVFEALGATFILDNAELDPDYKTSNIIDPNEHRSDSINRMKKRASETKVPWLAVDPDGDRGSLIEVDGQSAVSMNGPQLLLLVAEQITHIWNPKVICDMRASLSLSDLKTALGEKMQLIPTEAGYPFFMRSMAKNDADIAVEYTLHPFINVMTNTHWGAPKTYSGYQGGDNAVLFLSLLLAFSKYKWSGRTSLEQLRFVQEKYSLKPTIADERKPSLPPHQDKYKYLIAEELKKYAKELPSALVVNFGDERVSLVSGVHITHTKTRAMMLARFSNTGSSFTISGEAYNQSDLDEMLSLGYQLLDRAVTELKSQGHALEFDFKDLVNYATQYDKSRYE